MHRGSSGVFIDCKKARVTAPRKGRIMRECGETHPLSNTQRAKGYGFQDINSGEFLHSVEEFSATVKTRARA